MGWFIAFGDGIPQRRRSFGVGFGVPRPLHLTMKTCLLIALALVASQLHSAPASPDFNDIKAQVTAEYDRAVAAAEALNVEQLLARVGENDNGALIINGELILSRREVETRTRSNFAALQSIKYTVGPRRVSVLSPDCALLVVDGTVDVCTSSGTTITRRFAHSVVYVRQNGSWRVLHSHQSSMPPSPSA